MLSQSLKTWPRGGRNCQGMKSLQGQRVGKSPPSELSTQIYSGQIAFSMAQIKEATRKRRKARFGLTTPIRLEGPFVRLRVRDSRKPDYMRDLMSLIRTNFRGLIVDGGGHMNEFEHVGAKECSA